MITTQSFRSSRKPKSYFTYTAKLSRTVKLVVKHLPSDLNIIDMKDDLKYQGVVGDISNLKMTNGSPSSCYLFSTPHLCVNKLKTVTTILSMRITLEPYRRNPTYRSVTVADATVTPLSVASCPLNT